MNKQKLFEYVFREMLDYIDNDLISRCAKWGINTHSLIKENNRLLMTVEATDEDAMFIYAISTAAIVADFGDIAFGDHNSFEEGHEFDLDRLGIQLCNLRGYIDDYTEVDQDSLLNSYEQNIIDTDQMQTTIWEYRKSIHDVLVNIYKQQGEKYPDEKIMETLGSLFITKNEETGGMEAHAFYNFYSGVEAYQYVSNGLNVER